MYLEHKIVKMCVVVSKVLRCTKYYLKILIESSENLM